VRRRIAKLKEAIETVHKCKAQHVHSELVIDLFGEEVAWDGVVDTFDIEGHPKAKRCYAWSFVQDGEPQYTTVLEIPPVDSPQSAVKVAIASKARSI
jgi:hypothetical protein